MVVEPTAEVVATPVRETSMCCGTTTDPTPALPATPVTPKF